jgi:microcystin-dependent protein
LPDLRGRVPVYQGEGISLGQRGGEETHTLNVSEIPAHFHQMMALAPNDGSGNTNIPTSNFFSNAAPNELYTSGGGAPQTAVLNPATITGTGGSQPHENRQPFLTLNFCIALQGIFPSRN